MAAHLCLLLTLTVRGVYGSCSGPSCSVKKKPALGNELLQFRAHSLVTRTRPVHANDHQRRVHEAPLVENLLQFDLSNVLNSNLGGKGPNVDGAKNLRFGNITSVDGKEVQLIVSASESYAVKNPDKNRKHGEFGQINMLAQKDADTTADFVFEFVFTDGTPASMRSTYFSVFDLDGGKGKNKGETDEIVKIAEHLDFWTSCGKNCATACNESLWHIDNWTAESKENCTNIIVERRKSGGWKFKSLVPSSDDDVDNPNASMYLTPFQKSKSVTFLIEDFTQFTFKFALTKSPSSTKIFGRNLWFAGASNLVMEPPPSTTTTTTTTCKDCTLVEDPHVTAFDGAHVSLISMPTPTVHSFQDQGRYDLVKDKWLVKHRDVQIQVRYMPDPSLPEQNLFAGKVAIGGPFLNGTRLIIEPRDGDITWNNEKVKWRRSRSPEHKLEFSVPALFEATLNPTSPWREMEQSNQGVVLELPMNVKMVVNRLLHHVNVKVSTKPLAGRQDGLCGNFNGAAADDTLEMIRQRDAFDVDPAQSLFEAK